MTEQRSGANENVLISSGEFVLMQTAKTEIRNPENDKSETVRLLLDSGSQRTYITENLAEKLKLKKTGEQEIRLATFGTETPKVIKTASTEISLKLNNGDYLNLSANIVPTISGTIQRKSIRLSMENLGHLVKSVELADSIPSENESSTIELLIGNDFYLDLVMSQRIEIHPGLYLLGSKLGWILTGRINEGTVDTCESSLLILTYGNNVAKTVVFASVDKVLPTKPDLEDFWNVEGIGITDSPTSSDDERALQQFNDTLKYEDGRYQVTWPWKETNPELPLNRELAVGR
ncbi:MAG: aspartyl protease family protein, partial [Candidatus Thiodiazotropha sp.]